LGNVDRLGFESVGGTALAVGDLVGDATLCNVLDVEVVMFATAEASSRLSKDICSRACWTCHDMGNNGLSPTLFFGTTHIPCVATVYPAHAPDATAAMATAAKTMCATSVRPVAGMAVAATTMALDPTV
jgi:hypothetical protein